MCRVRRRKWSCCSNLCQKWKTFNDNEQFRCRMKICTRTTFVKTEKTDSSSEQICCFPISFCKHKFRLSTRFGKTIVWMYRDELTSKRSNAQSWRSPPRRFYPRAVRTLLSAVRGRLPVWRADTRSRRDRELRPRRGRGSPSARSTLRGASTCCVFADFTGFSESSWAEARLRTLRSLRERPVRHAIVGMRAEARRARRKRRRPAAPAINPTDRSHK